MSTEEVINLSFDKMTDYTHKDYQKNKASYDQMKKALFMNHIKKIDLDDMINPVKVHMH